MGSTSPVWFNFTLFYVNCLPKRLFYNDKKEFVKLSIFLVELKLKKRWVKLSPGRQTSCIARVGQGGDVVASVYSLTHMTSGRPEKSRKNEVTKSNH